MESSEEPSKKPLSLRTHPQLNPLSTPTSSEEYLEIKVSGNHTDRFMLELLCVQCMRNKEVDTINLECPVWRYQLMSYLLPFCQQIDVEAEYKMREQTNKAQINLVVIGKITSLAAAFDICVLTVYHCENSSWTYHLQ